MKVGAATYGENYVNAIWASDFAMQSVCFTQATISKN